MRNVKHDEGKGLQVLILGGDDSEFFGPSYTIFFSLYYRIHLFLSSDLNVTISPIPNEGQLKYYSRLRKNLPLL